MALAEYIQQCIDLLESMNDKGLLHGLGELMEDSIKPIGRFITLFLLAIRLFIVNSS